MRIKGNKERKSLKIAGERFFEKLPSLLNRQITGFKPLKGGLTPPSRITYLYANR
jgi:hypothetical protein